MSRKAIIFCMAFTILLSGAAGFGGAALAVGMNEKELRPIDEFAVNTDGFVEDDFWSDGFNEDELTPDGFAANGFAENEFAPDGFTADNFASPAEEVIPLSSSASNRTVLTIPQIVSAVSDTVVEIATEQVVNSGYFGSYVRGGAGSGVIISTDGFIITNNHVIQGASSISVRLKNGTVYGAELVGRDSITDLAVIKIEASRLKSAVYGNSASLVVGEMAVAIGNPLGQLGGTVTEGIISALNRDVTLSDGTVMNLLQTSAAISPGNSGGGLFNAYGELVGIVNAKSGGSNVEGIGFAIPSATVKSIVDQLTNYGYVQGRIDFGIQMIDIHDIFTAMRYGVNSPGVYVSKNDSDSGLRAGDQIIGVEGVEVSSSAQVKAVYSKYKVGDTLSLVIVRGGRKYEAEVTIKQAQG